MSWQYVVGDDYKFEEKAKFEGVYFHTGRWGKLHTTILWPGEKKNERDAMKVVEAFLSKPLTHEWFDMHKEVGDIDDCNGVFRDGQQRGDLLGSRTWYWASKQKGKRCRYCVLLIDCDS